MDFCEVVILLFIELFVIFIDRNVCKLIRLVEDLKNEISSQKKILQEK